MIDPTTLEMYMELGENEQIYNKSGREVLIRSVPSFPTMNTSNLFNKVPIDIETSA